MLNSWGLILGIIGFIGMVVIGVMRAKRNATNIHKKDLKRYANTEVIYDLPEYKSAKNKYRVMIGMLAVTIITAVIASSVLVARPVDVTVGKPSYEKHDIMFCLDMSGSMSDLIKEMLHYFSNIMTKFEGQRIGLTVFDGIYMNLSPLSDDYDALSELFDDVEKNANSYASAFYAAQSSTSEIGAGLVGCVESFDKLGTEERSRAIILVTDNYHADTQIISLADAANYASRYNIVVYGLSTSDQRSQSDIDSVDGSQYESQVNKEFREAMLSTDGAYYTFAKDSSDEIAVKEISDRILEQVAARYEGTETLVRTDNPLVPTLVTTISLAVLAIIIWRLGL